MNNEIPFTEIAGEPAPADTSANTTAADYWSANYFSESFNRAEWQAHPLAHERLAGFLDGKYREQWFADKYIGERKLKRALGIGVGRAETEIGLLASGAVDHFDLWDISPVGLDHAKAIATEKGWGHRVTCHLGDFSAFKIEENSYDLVTFVASLHHFSDLDAVLSKVRRGLASGGLLWAASEYIGPDRFNYPPEHRRIAEIFHARLPEGLRKHGLPHIVFPTPEEVEAADPSESPSSSQIVGAMERVFGDYEMVSLYGCLPFIIFWGLNHDSLYNTIEGRELVRFILAMDVALTDAGVTPTYFANLIGRKA